LKQLNRLLRYAVIDIKFNREIMTTAKQLHKQTLSQAIEAMGKKKNLQFY